MRKRVSRWSAMGLVVLSALLYSASFPPLELFGLAWCALVPLLVAAARSSIRAAAGLGFLWGVLLCLVVGWPFAPMLSRHLGLPPWLGWVAFLFAAPALIALYVAGFAGWVAFAAGRGWCRPLYVSAAWVATEFARQHFSAGIPWALSGYSQMPWLPAAQLADLAGPFGIAAVLAAVNAQLAGALAPALRSRRPAASAGALLVLLGVLYAYGSLRLTEAPEERPPVRIGLAQGGFATGQSDAPDPSEALDRYIELSEEIAAHEPELVVWPEFALAFDPTRTSLEALRLTELTELTDGEIITGGPHLEWRGGDLAHYNSVYLIAGGRVAARYDKQRPLPVAERSALGIRRRLGLPSYRAGERTGVVDTRAGRIGIVLCSEAMAPALARRRVGEGAEILLNPSNDSWFGDEPAVRQQLRIASMRAIESRRYLLRPTPTGYSAVVDPWGRIVRRSDLDTVGTLVADVTPQSRVSPYHRLGDVLPWLALALVAIASTAPRRRR